MISIHLISGDLQHIVVLILLIDMVMKELKLVVMVWLLLIELHIIQAQFMVNKI
jgi:hypothetical protein